VTERRRVVFDTNVFISGALSKSLTSPTRELLDRWERNEFTLLMCDALNDELIGKLLERQDRQGIAFSVGRAKRPAWLSLRGAKSHKRFLGQGSASFESRSGPGLLVGE
jgi:predicted nucleic acid-binding protein